LGILQGLFIEQSASSASNDNIAVAPLAWIPMRA
jgi:hypothetical protein